MQDWLRHLPNLITLARIALVLPVVWLLLKHEYGWALLLFFIAGFSDGLDGFLARRYHWFSRFGSIADPVADKLLLVSTFVTLTYIGLIPLWLTLLVLGRDLLILGGALVYHYTLGAYDIEPSRLGKISTFFQVVYVLALICDEAGLEMPYWLALQGAWFVAGLAFVSGAHYVWAWGQRYADGRRQAQLLTRPEEAGRE